jgi:MurNAc alpha-1-phosphate uridylyltransferase
MLNALPLLGDAPFLAVNGDIYSDLDYTVLPPQPQGLAYLVMIDNPAHHPDGDFLLDTQGQLHAEGAPRLTFSGIGMYRRELFEGWRGSIGAATGADATPPRFKLAPLLRAAMAAGQVHGTHHRGTWADVGTPARLADLDTSLRRQP